MESKYLTPTLARHATLSTSISATETCLVHSSTLLIFILTDASPWGAGEIWTLEKYNNVEEIFYSVDFIHEA